jgi:Uma2 family endonuclease
MTTVILGEHPEVQAMIEQRRARGQDGRDEVWEGVYYVTPHAHVHHGLVQIRLGRLLDDLAGPRGLTVGAEFNLGEPDDYRVPDLGVHRGTPDGLYLASAAMVVEILSPKDKTFEKFAFYGRHDVDEIMVVDVDARTVRVWHHDGTTDAYTESAGCSILGSSCADLVAGISWP